MLQKCKNKIVNSTPLKVFKSVKLMIHKLSMNGLSILVLLSICVLTKIGLQILVLGHVKVGDRRLQPIEGIGTVKIKLHNGQTIFIDEVRFVLSLYRNLLSEGILNAQGYKINVVDGIKSVIADSTVVMKAIKSGNLFVVQTIEESNNNVTEEMNNWITWHQRLDHARNEGI